MLIPIQMAQLVFVIHNCNGVVSNSVNITGLQPSTSYSYEIVLYCTSPSGWGNWSCTGTFTTGSSGCPTNLNVGSPVIDNHTYQAGNSLESDATIPANFTVTFLSGQTITLLQGFIATATSNFIAKITTCTPLQDTPIVSESRINSTKESSLPFRDDLKIVIQPNPAKDLVFINYWLDAPTKIKIGLYDLTGKKLKVILPLQQQSKGQHLQQFDLSTLSPGMYFMMLQQEGKSINTEKFIVAK